MVLTLHLRSQTMTSMFSDDGVVTMVMIDCEDGT